MVVAPTRAAACLRGPLERAIGARSAAWCVPPTGQVERPLPARAAALLGDVPFAARDADDDAPRIVGVGEAALLAFEAAAQLVAKRRPPAGLALIDPPPVPPAAARGGYRPPLVDLDGLLVLTAGGRPPGAIGMPSPPDPRLEWVAQYRHAPKLVRLEGRPFDLHDADHGARQTAEAIAAALTEW